jgi:hypothetical protein
VAAFTGSTNGFDPQISVLKVIDDPSSPSGMSLYVGGTFTHLNGGSVFGLARWNGQTWSDLQGGFTVPSGGMSIDALCRFGSMLYVGGRFGTAGGTPASHVARWDGAQWAALGGGTDNHVYALTVGTPDGAPAPVLYIGGEFAHAGGVAAGGIAQWNGSEWASVDGAQIGGANFPKVLALAEYQGELYAGGTFASISGTAFSRLARLHNGHWAALGDGVMYSPGAGFESAVRALEVLRIGGSERLLVGGSFNVVGGLAGDNLGAWDGSTLSPISPGPGGDGVWGMTSVTYRPLTNPSSLYLCGNFYAPPLLLNLRVARWGPQFCYADCNGDCALSADDFSCFLLEFVAGNLGANCDGSVQPPTLNVADFSCYLRRFAAQCGN